MKRTLPIIISVLIIAILIAAVFFLDYYNAKVLSIKIENQSIDDEIIVSEVNMPNYGFVFVSQTVENGKRFVGTSGFLTKGKHQNIKIIINNESRTRLDKNQNTFSVKLLHDTTGERLADVSDDLPLKSYFGFEYSKDFFSK